jgi:2-oxo-4-hydroxy-4-carboxy-5-ureidoimidazoline decarboxylase
MTRAIGIEAVNAMDRAAFVAHFGGVYENSPWVADVAWDARPFGDRAALADVLMRVVLGADRQRQLDLLRQHPRLGTRRKLIGHSKTEQAGAGILAAGQAEREELDRLNQEYEAKFGFPFILAVRDATLPDILSSFRARIGSTVRVEFDESLRQVFRIAHFRLADLVTDGEPPSR